MITVLDMDGEPVDGVELLFVEPFMPAHGHDGTFEPTVAVGSGPGEFAVDRINLWMGGDWEVRFFLTHGADEGRWGGRQRSAGCIMVGEANRGGSAR